MPILTGDIKLVASQVMDDVPEGGGAPTATVILDGTSNAIFPDISELDRAGGRVNLRKLHISVQTADTATYMGSNIIVAEPPDDPNVSVTLFTTGNTFDRRDAAKGRIESYLTQGPEWSGYLFENHIQGQRAIQIFQRPGTAYPAIGHTLVLIYNEGLQAEVKQYIRITRTVSEMRTFYDEQTGKDYEAQVVTAEISDALRTDFTGSPPKRSFTRDATSTHLRDTLVADAGTYAGVVPLTAPVALGSLTSHVKGVYTQLVPSAQTEIPLVDYSAAGQSTALTASANGTVSYTTAQALTSTTALSLGFAVLPGTLRITSGAVVLTDAGGEVFIGTSAVGLIDYARGLITLAGLTSSYTDSKTVVFTPASAPMRLPNTSLRQVTQETRAYNYTMVALPTPAPGSVIVSYMSNGNWYDLRDNGSGALKGLDSSFGVGTVNYSTGSILLTCGALPDVGSAILWGWNSPNNYINRSTLSVPASLVRLQVAHPPIQPASVAVTWHDGTARTATDDGKGNLTGAATGKIYYETGLVELSPTALPAGGQQYSVAYSSADAAAAKAESYESAVLNPDGSVVMTLGTPGVTPGTVRLSAQIRLADGIDDAGSSGAYQKSGWDVRPTLVGGRDDGNGVIKTTTGVAVGTIVYATGVITLHPNGTRPGVYYDYRRVLHVGWGPAYILAAVTRGLVACTLADNATITANYYAAGSPTVRTPEVFASTSLKFDLTPEFGEEIVPGSVLLGCSGKTYFDKLGSLYNGLDITTGAAALAGSINYQTGAVEITNWTPGSANAVTLSSLLTVTGTQTVERAAFRVPVAPIRPGSLQILATKAAGGLINVTADLNGIISGAGVRGTVDYQTGVVALLFGELVAAAGNESQGWYRAADVVAGNIWRPGFVFADTLKFNAVAYAYLPLDANLLGLDPVRLPQDGRVPIFRKGGFAVLGNTQRVSATVANGQVLNAGRVRLSRVRVLGSDKVVINTGYAADLEAGTVTFTNVSGYAQPVTVEHRIEDMMQVSDVQISGQLGFTRQVTHDYPVSGSYLSSALISADLKARVSYLFDQQTWNGTSWLDGISGSAATGTFNDVFSPIVVTNKGAVSERWALVFTNTTSFNVIGEHVGVIAIGSTNTDLSPNNPATNTPYFTVPALGWGIGWAAGNMLRFNTVGAMTPVWVVRTIQQGPNTGIQHSFTLLSRGDVDRP